LSNLNYGHANESAVSKRIRAVSQNSKITPGGLPDISHAIGGALERNPREAAVIQSFVERKIKGVVLPKGEAKQADFVAKTNHSVLTSVMKSRECREAAKKILRDYEGTPIIRASPGNQRPKPRELFWWIVGIIVVIAVAGCVKDKPHQSTSTGGGIMQPGSSQGDPVNQGGGGSTDGGTDGSD
jgi:hypothetical protein